MIPNPTLADQGHRLWHVLTQFKRRLERRLEGFQIPIVDPDQTGSRAQGTFEFFDEFRPLLPQLINDAVLFGCRSALEARMVPRPIAEFLDGGLIPGWIVEFSNSNGRRIL